jgi:acetyl esterase/lipase
MNRRLFLAAPTLLAGCSPSLAAFDALAPRDSGTRRVLRDQAYGPGLRQHLDLYAPAEAPVAPRPVIVFIYGGSWRSGDKDDYNFMGAALAAQGFVVAIPDYRLVPEVRFPSFVEDCAQAVRWAAESVDAYGGDPTRLVLMGHSAGAYNTMMLALDGRFLAVANVDQTIVKGAIGLAGPYDFLPFDVSASIEAFGQHPDPLATQPITYARADAPPLFLAWGEDDTTVGPRNIAGLESAMIGAGGAVETKRYPGVDHVEIMLALSRPFRGVAPVLQDVVGFADRVTGQVR